MIQGDDPHTRLHMRRSRMHARVPLRLKHPSQTCRNILKEKCNLISLGRRCGCGNICMDVYTYIWSRFICIF